MLLWVIFMVVVLIEAFVLFQGLSSAVSSPRGEAGEGQAQVSKVDLPAYEETLEWLQTREDYTIPDYSLQTSATVGRENPFLE